jgi:hypothetical protein
MLLLSPVPAVAQAPAAAADDISSRRAKALELAQLVEPREVAGASARMEAQYVAGLLAVPEIAELEAQYPGIAKAMWQAMGPELEREAQATLPVHWARLADIYSNGMTLQQIEQAVAFMGSPTGRKMVRGVSEGLVTPAMGLLAESEDQRLSKEALGQAKDKAAESMVRGMTQEELAQIAAFGASPAGAALLSLAPQVQQASLEWLNTSDPESEARLDALVGKGVEDFIAASEAAKAKTNR